MIWSSCSVLWICTNILVSRPISQRREDWSGLPEFPHLLGAAVVPRCGSTERQEASVHCCCYWEAGCWTSRANLPAWRLLQLLFHCAQHRAHSVEQQWWAEATMLHSHMDRHTQIWECHATATPPARYCHSFLTKQNSAHGMVSVGVIIFIIWIILLTTVLIVWRHTLFGEWRED